MEEYRLTTIDNPYDPFTQFDEWIMYDKEKGYNTSELLARLVNITPQMKPELANEVINDTIDLIVDNDSLKIYKKVKKDPH